MQQLQEWLLADAQMRASEQQGGVASDGIYVRKQRGRRRKQAREEDRGESIDQGSGKGREEQQQQQQVSSGGEQHTEEQHQQQYQIQLQDMVHSLHRHLVLLPPIGTVHGLEYVDGEGSVLAQEEVSECLCGFCLRVLCFRISCGPSARARS